MLRHPRGYTVQFRWLIFLSCAFHHGLTKQTFTDGRVNGMMNHKALRWSQTDRSVSTASWLCILLCLSAWKSQFDAAISRLRLILRTPALQKPFARQGLGSCFQAIESGSHASGFHAYARVAETISLGIPIRHRQPGSYMQSDDHCRPSSCFESI
jgi:hypothetical protein